MNLDKTYTYKIDNNNSNIEYWDIDCDCNLLNDITGDYGFHEDRGAVEEK